ncbi:hypothetical protein C8J57DRAFT_1221097 [Mycena rebaudengoi]|nr:hypothetical protein C8J57DRAFT_1221097 [Mycena rebaudengoi]
MSRETRERKTGTNGPDTYMVNMSQHLVWDSISESAVRNMGVTGARGCAARPLGALELGESNDDVRVVKAGEVAWSGNQSCAFATSAAEGNGLCHSERVAQLRLSGSRRWGGATRSKHIIQAPEGRQRVGQKTRDFGGPSNSGYFDAAQEVGTGRCRQIYLFLNSARGLESRCLVQANNTSALHASFILLSTSRHLFGLDAL